MLSAFLLTLFTALSVAAAAVQPNMVLGSNGILKFDHWKNDAYPAANQTASATQFVATTTWTSTTACSGTVDTVHGTGFGICYTDGSDSYILSNPKSSQGYVSYSSDWYRSNKDCSNTKYGTLTYQYPETCTLSEGNTGRKYSYSLINSATPWTTFKFAGVVTKGYFAPNACSSSAAFASFSITTPTNCVLTGGSYPDKYTYEKWTACANGYITKSEYLGGLTCDSLTLTSSSQVKVGTCVANSKNVDTESQICYSG